MKRGTVVQGRLLTEAHELAEAKELRRRIARVSRPSEDNWKVMRRLKQLLEVHTPGDWPSLLHLTEAIIARAEHARMVQAKDLKVGDKVWYVLCPGELPLAGEVQRITECYHVVVRLLDSHPAGNKAVTISPSSALTSEAEVAECRRQAAAYEARIEAITPPDVTESVSRTADAAGERGETMSWECLGPGEYASADRLWTILHVARGWSVASAALQVAGLEKTLAAAKDWAEQQSRLPLRRSSESDPTRPGRPLVNTAEQCAECQTALGPDRYNINPATGTRTAVRAWCPACFERVVRRC